MALFSIRIIAVAFTTYRVWKKFVFVSFNLIISISCVNVRQSLHAPQTHTFHVMPFAKNNCHFMLFLDRLFSYLAHYTVALFFATTLIHRQDVQLWHFFSFFHSFVIYKQFSYVDMFKLSAYSHFESTNGALFQTMEFIIIIFCQFFFFFILFVWRFVLFEFCCEAKIFTAQIANFCVNAYEKRRKKDQSLFTCSVLVICIPFRMCGIGMAFGIHANTNTRLTCDSGFVQLLSVYIENEIWISLSKHLGSMCYFAFLIIAKIKCTLEILILIILHCFN